MTRVEFLSLFTDFQKQQGVRLKLIRNNKDNFNDIKYTLKDIDMAFISSSTINVPKINEFLNSNKISVIKIVNKFDGVTFYLSLGKNEFCVLDLYNVLNINGYYTSLTKRRYKISPQVQHVWYLIKYAAYRVFRSKHRFTVKLSPDVYDLLKPGLSKFGEFGRVRLLLDDDCSDTFSMTIYKIMNYI